MEDSVLQYIHALLNDLRLNDDIPAGYYHDRVTTAMRYVNEAMEVQP